VLHAKGPYHPAPPVLRARPLQRAAGQLPRIPACLPACLQGGNDYEIFSSEKTIGHTVNGPDDTRKQCTELFLH
jgi:hypothetical protein